MTIYENYTYVHQFASNPVSEFTETWLPFNCYQFSDTRRNSSKSEVIGYVPVGLRQGLPPPEVHPASYPMGTGGVLFTGRRAERLEREVTHLHWILRFRIRLVLPPHLLLYMVWCLNTGQLYCYRNTTSEKRGNFTKLALSKLYLVRHRMVFLCQRLNTTTSSPADNVHHYVIPQKLLDSK
jgi:hypothetical protein